MLFVCTFLIVCDQSDDYSISHCLQGEWRRLVQVCKLLMSKFCLSLLTMRTVKCVHVDISGGSIAG